MDQAPVTPDPFARLREMTPARVRLGRVGQGLPTAAMLEFQLAHARARDAVHASLDIDHLRRSIASPTLLVESAAGNRASYLQNPGLGRTLAKDQAGLVRGAYDLGVVVADGLSAGAVNAHAAEVVERLVDRLPAWTLAPVVIARLARVALGDSIGEALGARAVVVLIGERPGLSSPDSLSAYLTWAPVRGRRDNERNCVSNIRTGSGLSADAAAEKLADLLHEARRLGFTGVDLKDRPNASGTLAASPLPAPDDRLAKPDGLGVAG